VLCDIHKLGTFISWIASNRTKGGQHRQVSLHLR